MVQQRLLQSVPCFGTAVPIRLPVAYAYLRAGQHSTCSKRAEELHCDLRHADNWSDVREASREYNQDMRYAGASAGMMCPVIRTTTP